MGLYDGVTGLRCLVIARAARRCSLGLGIGSGALA